jgi:hypothetical protein
MRGKFCEDLGQVRIDARDRRPLERSGEVAIAAMRGTAFGEVDPPVGAGGDRLELAFRRRRDDQRQRGLGLSIGAARIVGEVELEAVARQRGDRHAQRGRARDNLGTVLPGQRGRRREQSLRLPES